MDPYIMIYGKWAELYKIGDVVFDFLFNKK